MKAVGYDADHEIVGFSIFYEWCRLNDHKSCEVSDDPWAWLAAAVWLCPLDPTRNYVTQRSYE